MEINFPHSIRRANDALWFACEKLFADGIDNFIHHNDVVTVEINGKHYAPQIDFARHVVVFDL